MSRSALLSCCSIALSLACSGQDAASDPRGVAGGAGIGGSSSSAGAGSAGAGVGGGGAAHAGAAPIAGMAGASVGGGTAGVSAGGGGAGGASGEAAGGAGGALGGAGGALGGAGGAAGGVGSDRCDVSRYDAAKPPKQLELMGNLGTHDPVVLEAGGKFYLFATGDNLAAKQSSDLVAWQGAPEPLPSAARPAWVAQQVPGVSNLWAPDASFFGGQYHLYYSASTFGSNRSCIGHLTRASLTSGSWADKGSVICTTTSDDYNAIDPNVIVDDAGTPWLSFGSFWSGIKMIKLDATGARDGTALVALASRPSNNGAVEAPFLVRRCGFYYLFVSWDTCCKGVDSTYNIRVGRSPSLTEPFVDREGKQLLQGGGTQVLQGGSRYKGPGHNAILFTAQGSYNVYHAYDANNNGAAVLRIAELAWDDGGWPVSAGP